MPDLIAGIVIVTVLLAFVLPASAQFRRNTVLPKCANNLRQIGLACTMYANGEVRTGAFPRTRYDVTNPDKVTAYTNWKSPWSFGVPKGENAKPGDEPPVPNDVTASLYLALKTQDITSDVFICPGGNAKAMSFGKAPAALAADATTLSNFPGSDNLSYSYSNPFPAKDALMAGWKFNNSLGADFVLLADMNPGGEAVLAVTPKSTKAEMAKANTPNHGGQGQNVLYVDCHVTFFDSPFCGMPLVDAKGQPTNDKDNIYSPQNAGGKGPVMGPPVSFTDVVMLPTADFKPQPGATTKPAIPAK